MNRFESGKHFHKIRLISLPALAFILLLFLFLQGVDSVADTTPKASGQPLTEASSSVMR